MRLELEDGFEDGDGLMGQKNVGMEVMGIYVAEERFRSLYSMISCIQ